MQSVYIHLLNNFGKHSEDKSRFDRPVLVSLSHDNKLLNLGNNEAEKNIINAYN